MERKTECEIVQDLLLGYVDGVLNMESKKLVEKHLTECKKCQEKLDEIKSDMKESEKIQKTQIDYLKKIRRRNRVKSVVMAIAILFLLCLVLYLNKFVKINHMMNQAEELLGSNNFYKETTQILSSNETSVSKEYYKDGKYKQVFD